MSGGATLYTSDHGSMSPWNVRNTLLAWGADFKKGAALTTPAGNVDVAPTILAALGLDEHRGMDGRVLFEALAGGPDPREVAVDTRTHTVHAGSYRAALQVSTVDRHRYVDKSWRIG